MAARGSIVRGFGSVMAVTAGFGLAAASQVLRQLVQSLRPKSLAVSSYGIREGLLYEQMPAGLRSRDPLIEAAMDWPGSNEAYEQAHAQALVEARMRWPGIRHCRPKGRKIVGIDQSCLAAQARPSR